MAYLRSFAGRFLMRRKVSVSGDHIIILLRILRLLALMCSLTVHLHLNRSFPFPCFAVPKAPGSAWQLFCRAAGGKAKPFRR